MNDPSPIELNPNKVEGWSRFYDKADFARSPGTVVVCANVNIHPLRAALSWAIVVSQFGTSEESGTDFAYPGIQILIPPSAPQKLTEQVNELGVSLLDEFGQEEPERLWPLIGRRFDLVRISTLQAPDLVEKVTAADPKTASFIFSPEKYQWPDVGGGSDNVRNSRQELQVHRLEKLIEELTLQGVDQGKMQLLFSGIPMPTEDHLVNALAPVEYTAVAGIVDSRQENLQEAFANLPEWIRRADDGDLESVLEEIDGTELSPENRDYAKAQLLHQAGLTDEAVAKIRPHIQHLVEEVDSTLCIHLATIADEGDARGLSRQLVRAAADKGIDNETPLQNALRIARFEGMTDLVGELQEQVFKLFPDSPTAVNEQFQLCESPEDYSAFVDRHCEPSVFTSSDEASKELGYLCLLADALSEGDDADYPEFIERVRTEAPEFEDRAVLEASGYEFDRGRPWITAELCLDHEWKTEEGVKTSVRMLLDVFEWGGVHGSSKGDLDDDNSPDQLELQTLVKCLDRIGDYLLSHPDHGKIRTRVTELLSPKHSGALGLTAVTHLLSPDAFPDSNNTWQSWGSGSVDEDTFKSFLEANIRQQQHLDFTLLGRGPDLKIPEGVHREDLIDEVHRTVRHISKAISSHEEVKSLWASLHIGMLLTGDEIRSYDLAESAAAGIVVGGFPQRARDLAEAILVDSARFAPSPASSRAWLAFADTYQRCQLPEDAVTGLLAAVPSGNNVSWPASLAYSAHRTASRVFRDLGNHSLALEHVEACRDITRNAGVSDRAEDYIEQIEISAKLQRFRGYTYGKDDLENRYRELCAKITEHSQRAREDGMDLTPVASMLNGAKLVAETTSLVVPSSVEEELREIRESVDSSFANPHLQRFTEGEVSIEGLSQFERALDQTRYHQDAAADALPIVSTIQQFLSDRARGDSALKDEPASRIVSLLEWLTDHSISPPGRREADQGMAGSENREIEKLVRRVTTGKASPAEEKRFHQIVEERDRDEIGPRPSAERMNRRNSASGDELLDFIKTVSNGGNDIQLLARAPGSSLFRAGMDDGELSIVQERTEVFDPSAFSAWSKDYPHAYSSEELPDGNEKDEFYRSLERIGLSLTGRECRSLTLIPETDLQTLPPNIFRIPKNDTRSGKDFLGELRPVAMAPSLSWLQAVHRTPFSPSGNSIAWIPKSDSSESAMSPLGILRRGVREATESTDVRFEEGMRPPEDLQGADLAIIGGHGGLHHENRWFRVVQDEGSVWLTPKNLAESVTDANIVVLFVCNAGRVDANPFVNSGTGLARKILDHGVRSVIASPWPLWSRVPSDWLPVFLESLHDGSTVSEANFEANRSLSSNDRYMHNPSHTLAMNVIGNPDAGLDFARVR